MKTICEEIRGNVIKRLFVHDERNFKIFRMPYNYFFSGEVLFEQRCLGPNFPPMKNKYLKAFCQLQSFRRQLKMIPNATNFVLKVKF